MHSTGISLAPHSPSKWKVFHCILIDLGVLGKNEDKGEEDAGEGEKGIWWRSRASAITAIVESSFLRHGNKDSTLVPRDRFSMKISNNLRKHSNIVMVW